MAGTNFTDAEDWIGDPTPWPLQDQYEDLASLDLDEVRGRNRLGVLAFEEAPKQLRVAQRVLADLSHANWAEVASEDAQAIITAVKNISSVIGNMRRLSASEDNARGRREALSRSLTAAVSSLVGAGSKYRVQAQVLRALANAPKPEDLESLANQIQEYELRAAALGRDLEALAQLSEVGRDVAASSGASELASDYRADADRQRGAWRLWGTLLLVSIALTTAVGIVVILVTHTSAATTNAQVVARTLIDLFVIGLMLYLVRIASLQFRVHRHLEAVSRNKAAALNTFNRIVTSASEPEVRTAIAVVLAEAVFKSDDSGFIDAGTEHVTLIERAVGPALQRISR